ncbi:serine hydrolase domain-containing protein [Aliikangiella coralliicola]|uniref:Beta-lactamase family protein n=1 Tax=Aliikangiella coralliicola TaxID=2592383 RepID=A0A545UJ14_9GAMM|nr:serine hydrolase domain-containing protein [Aliikangiella coralliicola]TQV89464.1 beta-lactamase family protein [Aliikangiella coralliicola]
MMKYQLLLLIFSWVTSTSAKADSPEIDLSTQQSLDKLVTEIQAKSKLVGLGAIVMQDNKTLAISTAGERKVDSGVKITTDDQWHIGSITKSMTATMIAQLVETGKLNWKTSVKDIFPKETKANKIHKKWHDITLEQFLTHTSGVKGNFSMDIQTLWPEEGKERMDVRKAQVLDVLKSAPELTPGKQFLYSNVGFTIAGVFAEQKTGKSWESLIRKNLFEPLALSQAGFGPPKDGDKELEQPRGHQKGLFGFGSPKAVSTEADNSPVMGPAGTIRMTLRELAAYANEHLQGEKGKGKLLKQSTYQYLHSAKLNDYAFGWVVQNSDMSGPVIWHNGSNTMWYALVVFFPELDVVIAVTSNDGNIKQAEKNAWKIVREMTKKIREKNS